MARVATKPEPIDEIEQKGYGFRVAIRDAARGQTQRPLEANRIRSGIGRAFPRAAAAICLSLSRDGPSAMSLSVARSRRRATTRWRRSAGTADENAAERGAKAIIRFPF